MVKGRAALRPELRTERSVVYSDRRGRLLVLPRGEVSGPIRITYESMPETKPAGRKEFQ